MLLQDARSRFQAAVAQTSVKSAVANQLRRASLEKQNHVQSVTPASTPQMSRDNSQDRCEFLTCSIDGWMWGGSRAVNYPDLSCISLSMVKTIKIGLTCFNIPTEPKTTCHGDKTSGTFLPLVYIYSFSFNYTWTLFSPSSCLTDALAVLSIALWLTSAPIYDSR